MQDRKSVGFFFHLHSCNPGLTRRLSVNCVYLKIKDFSISLHSLIFTFASFFINFNIINICISTHKIKIKHLVQ